MINKYDMHKLIDDLKRVSRIVPILRDELNKKQRERLGQLALDELQKLTDDLVEIRKRNGNSGKVYSQKELESISQQFKKLLDVIDNKNLKKE